MARAEAPATVHGQPVAGLTIQIQNHRPPHLVTLEGAFEMESTLRYFRDMPESPAHGNSPFRPHRLGTHRIKRVQVLQGDVLVETDGGTIRIPPDLVVYSYQI